MKKLLIILAIILIPSLAFANFSIKFENTFNKKMFYFLYWIDHPFNWPAPANMAGGELEALESMQLESNYKSGRYLVIWRDGDKWERALQIHIGNDIALITVRPEKVNVSKRDG